MTDTTAGEGVVVYGDERDEMLAALREKCPNLYALPECPPDDLLKAGEDSRADEAIQRELDRVKTLASQPSASPTDATAGEGVNEVIAALEALTKGDHPTDEFERGARAARLNALDMLWPLATPAQPDTGDVAALREALRHADAVADLADELIEKGLRLTPDGLMVREARDNSDPHYRLCGAITERRTILAALSKPNAPGREG